MNPNSLTSLSRVRPAISRISRSLIRLQGAAGVSHHSSLPSSPVRAVVSPYLNRRCIQTESASLANLVSSPHRRSITTVARAVGSSAADFNSQDFSINSNNDSDTNPPPPPPLPPTSKKTSSELLDEALFSPPLPPAEPAPAIIVADSCVKRLKEIGESRLRIVVEGGGCSGFQYKFEVGVEVDPENDLVFANDGVEVIVDDSSIELIRGSVVEFHTELIRSAFRISANPLAEKGCSCGASFSVKF